jgi:hypothetical protein
VEEEGGGRKEGEGEGGGRGRGGGGPPILCQFFGLLGLDHGLHVFDVRADCLEEDEEGGEREGGRGREKEGEGGGRRWKEEGKKRRWLGSRTPFFQH